MFGRSTRGLALVLSLFFVPAQAEENRPQKLPFLFGKGLELLFDRLPPEIQGFERLLEGPIEYGAPEVLPNGDIILRRKKPLPVPLPEGQIDL